MTKADAFSTQSALYLFFVYFIELVAARCIDAAVISVVSKHRTKDKTPKNCALDPETFL